jgi:hypothetical protein
MTSKQVWMSARLRVFPHTNESDLDSETKWAGYEARYRFKRVANPVMHRAETDRNHSQNPTNLRKSPLRASRCRSPPMGDGL